MQRNMSYAEREKKIKGLACTVCGRNVPDVDRETRRVWCWQCVLQGKYNGDGPRPRRLVKRETPVDASSERGQARNQGKAALPEIAAGKLSYTFTGGKGGQEISVFTGGPQVGAVVVQDRKGVTHYDLTNEAHLRIVTARLWRWLNKAKPTVQNQKLPVKGPKLDVRVKENK